MANDRPVVWMVVAAAGTGTRYGADKPKQYLDLAGRSVAEHTLSKLASAELFKAIVVVLSEGDKHFDQLDLVCHSLANSATTKETASDSRVIVERAMGGETRAQSVLNGLLALQGRADPNDWVMVHDIARPLISHMSLRRLMTVAVDNQCSAILAAPVHDTTKQVSPDLTAPTIQSTLDRRQLWSAQTPQIFPYRLLLEALTQAIDSEAPITDEASALERLGAKVLIVENSRHNIKITTPEDMQMAAFYLSLDSKDC